MTTILSILATRAGGIGAMVLVCLLTVTAGGLGLSLWLTSSDLADERLRANTLESAVKLQNDEVMDWQAQHFLKADGVVGPVTAKAMGL